jgi:uncharacterized protein
MKADAPADVRETHSAVVLLFGDRAYKIKKPVDLGFLDFRSDASRRAVCERELELNRRLAPDVYLDVFTIRGSSGDDFEHGVVMRRMPECLRLSTLIRGGTSVDEHLRALARLIAHLPRGGSAGAAHRRGGQRSGAAPPVGGQPARDPGLSGWTARRDGL